MAGADDRSALQLTPTFRKTAEEVLHLPQELAGGVLGLEGFKVNELRLLFDPGFLACTAEAFV